MRRGDILFGILAIGIGVWIANGTPLPSVSSGDGGNFPSPVLSSTPAASMAPVPVSFRDVRAIYLTAGMASVPRRLGAVVQLVEDSELNAVVVNVKDGDGTYLGPGMEGVARKLREHGIYPIARIVVFQDNTLTRTNPEFAVRGADGAVWADAGGYRWVDPANREVWDRVASTAERAIDIGFLEVNFDYIRFPSDGDVGELSYPSYDGVTPKDEVLASFFGYLTERIHKNRPGVALSADVFGFTFISRGDLGIGQRLEVYGRYFDVLSPMLYPSHFSPGTFGFENPAEHPYELVGKTLASGLARLRAVSSTAVVRPWIQDFNMGAIYDAPLFREQIRATLDAGAGDTWMAWNPSNIYDPEKFIRAPEER